MEDGPRLRQTGAFPSDSPLNNSARYEGDKTRRDEGLLGFRHWLFALVVLGAVYAGVIYFHERLPPVRAALDYNEFSEARARVFLKAVTALGPRPSGSAALEKEAFPLLRKRLDETAEAAGTLGQNRVEIDTQHPSGCFDLKFLSSFTLCYENVTNVVARLGPATGPASHALLLNCHIDTMPDTPGATDDAVSCAIMLEVLDVLARSDKPLKYDIVFLFNGAEENFLQGAHGFIETHPWRHTIRSFINLEGTGSGGREILFQAGPGNSWLLKTYLENAPHPYCSIIAQEVFQSGIIPSDTDFRIFRDFGRISGLDIAYTRNGWIYHTEFDTEARIDQGSVQRAGDNVLAVVRAVLESNHLAEPSKAAEQNNWVFYDVVGLFTVCYSVATAKVINTMAALLCLFLVTFRLQSGIYHFSDLLSVFLRHFLSIVAMAVAMVLLVLVVILFDLTMCWYSMPELVGPLYVLPLVLVGLYVHSNFAARHNIRNAEMLHTDSVLVVLSALLLWMTSAGLSSSFVLFNYVFFALLRDPLLWFFSRLGLLSRVTPRWVLGAQLVCLLPGMLFAAYAISQCVDFFVPVMGRLGRAVNPEWIMAPIALLIATTFILFTNNLVYISRPLNYGYRILSLLFLFFFLALLTTRLGLPYVYSEAAPRTRRLIALHTQRTVMSFSGERESQETTLFVQSLDYRSTADLPAHSFLQASAPPDCNVTRDEYCRLPYYTSIHEMLPPREALWVPVPSPPTIPFPIDVKLLSRTKVGSNQLNISYELNGGYDKMSLHITPINGFHLKAWTFTPLYISNRTTYFVFLAYASETPPTRRFSLLLEHDAEMPAVGASASIEMAVASHHAHGKFQESETISQLRSLIKSRRRTPHMAIGWWKWACTMIAGVSEIVIYQH